MSPARSLESLTADDFRGIGDSQFRLTGGSREDGSEAAFTAVVAEVTEYPAGAQGTFRTPFSVLFHGPAEPVMPQGIYRLEHERLGPLEFFVVPLGPSESPAPGQPGQPGQAGQAPAAMRYEAVFG